MSSRRRYRASNFGTRISRSTGLLGPSVLTSSYRNREPSDYSISKLVNVNPGSVASDESIYNRSRIHSLNAKEKSYQNKHFSLESKSHDEVKDNHQETPVPDVNPLTEMEIKSAAQWRAVSGRVSWNLKNPERLEKHAKAKRARARQRVPTKPRDRTRY